MTECIKLHQNVVYISIFEVKGYPPSFQVTYSQANINNMQCANSERELRKMSFVIIHSIDYLHNLYICI